MVNPEPRNIITDINSVKEARAYTVENFGFTKDSFVGWMPANEFDAAVDHIVAFADKAHELLGEVLDSSNVGPGLTEDIALTLGLVHNWRCECGDMNRYNEAFCYRCGSTGPEESAS